MPPLAKSPQLLQPPQLRKTASVRDDPAALAKRRSRLHELRAASSSSSSSAGNEAAAAFTKRESKRDRRRALDRGASSSSSGGAGGTGESPAMRKSHSLDAAESYSLASIQAPLWVTLTNARTIEELAQQKL